MDYLTALDVNQKIEVLKEVCSKERDGNRSKLEIPGINPRTQAAGKSETRRPSVDKLCHLKKIWDWETLIQRLQSLLGTHGQTGCPSGKGEWSYKTPLALKQQEEDRQVGWEYPPAGLLVS